MFGEDGWCHSCGVPKGPQSGSIVLQSKGMRVEGGWVPNWQFDAICMERSVAEEAASRFRLESGESVTKEAETPAFDRRRMDANAACDLIRGVLALARQDDPCPSCSSLLGRCGAHPALELGTYATGDRDGNRRSPSTSHAATRSPR
jgi:hypothetical protein